MNEYPPEIENETSSRRVKGRFPVGTFLVIAGALLFLSNLGLFPQNLLVKFWPLLVVGLGIKKLSTATEPRGKVIGVLLLILAFVAFTNTLGIFQIHTHHPTFPLSILFVVFGSLLLLRRPNKRIPIQSSFDNWRPANVPLSSHSLSDVAIFGSVKRKMDILDFQGGHLLNVGGYIELDLRSARIAEPGQSVSVEVTSMMGATKIRVPDSWRVHMQAIGLFSNYEDKTVPPNMGSAAPMLVVGGHSLFSSVEIEH